MKYKLTLLLAALPLLITPGLSRAADESPKPYSLDTCVVSGEKLGEMGDPYVFVYEGQEIKLCCKDCKKKFDKDPEKYLKKLQKENGKSEARLH